MLPFLVIFALLGFGAWWLVTQPFVKPKGGARAGANPKRLEKDVLFLANQAPRDARHPKSLEKVADHVAKTFREAGGSVVEIPYVVDGMRYRVVTAGFGPEGGSRVVVGAHYDAFSEFPGADDNASGTAGLLELARLLGEERLLSRVELAAYPLEEPPHFRSDMMGSFVHAKWLKDANASLKVMICLEMLGCFTDAEGSQAYPYGLFKLFYPTRGDFITVVGRVKEAGLVRKVKASMLGATDLPVRSFNAPQGFPAIDFSDHLSFWRTGFPAVMVTDTAFYRNPRYHTKDDTPDTLDYPRMAKVVDGVYRAVLDF